MKLKIFILLAASIGVATYFYCATYKDRLRVSVAAPDDYVRGAVFTLHAKYERDGQLSDVVLDDRVLENTGTFEIKLPARTPWSLREMRAELQHPKYQPAQVSVTGNPHWSRQELELESMRWTTNEKHTFIQPSHDTSIAVLDHLRWITTDYFSRPEWLLINEAVQQNYQLLGRMAYANGKKSGEWESLRQQTIAELGTLKEAIDERALEPCPEGYEVENLAYPACGRQEMNIQYYPTNSAQKKAEQAEEIRLWLLAGADLVERLGVEKEAVRFAGFQRWMWNSSALGCPAEGQSYIEEEEPGYMILFTVAYGGTHYYHGREGDDPFYCPEERRSY